jgi:hypothetical protein
MHHVARVLLAASALAAAACGGRDAGSGTETGAATAASRSADSAAAAAAAEFKVATVMIGKRIGPSKLITEPTFQFAPTDTVYVSVGTTGKADAVNLAAIWHFQSGKLVDSSAQTIHPQGPETSEFHVANPKGWPVGTYKVTIYADGDSVEAKTFAVKK